MGLLSKYVKRLSRRDPTLKQIHLDANHHIDSEIADLTDCLLANPGVVTYVGLGGNELTDETGVKLARCLAASSTVNMLNLSGNQLGLETYLALTEALCVNSSLQYLYLDDNRPVYRTRIDAAFVRALRLNSIRSTKSIWLLYSQDQDDFERLKDVAEKSTPPSMLEFLLCVHFETETNKLKTH
jgi:hypothetical protein